MEEEVEGSGEELVFSIVYLRQIEKEIVEIRQSKELGRRSRGE
jgi:hypothetical protein